MADFDRPIPAGCSIAIPLGEALGPLTRLWRETRHADVATRLIALSDGYADFFGKLPKKGGLFFEMVSEAQDRHVTVLLRSTTHGNESTATRRLEGLWQTWSDDPRVLVFIERWQRSKAYTSGSEFMTALLRVMDDYERRAPPVAVRPQLNESDHQLLGQVDALIASLPKRRAALGLLKDVYTHPRDTGRRVVFSDALLDLGDAQNAEWGELIAIQCARSAPAREKALLKNRPASWLGRLAPYIHDEPGVVFEEGFPAAVAPAWTSRGVGIPEWSTIRRLMKPHHFGSGWWMQSMTVLERVDVTSFTHASSAEVAVAVSPNPNRQSIQGQNRNQNRNRKRNQNPNRQLAALANRGQGIARPRGRNSAIEQLTLNLATSRREDAELITQLWAQARSFPNLKRLALRCPSVLPSTLELALALVMRTRFGRSVREIGVQMSLVDLGRQFAQSFRAGASQPGFPLIHEIGSEITIRSDPAKNEVTVEVRKGLDVRRLVEPIASVASKVRVEVATTAWVAVAQTAWPRTVREKLEVVKV